MDSSKCILQVRGVRPFLSQKYDIEKHHNYKYLADADKNLEFSITDFVNVFKENKAQILQGLNKKNTKRVVIVIDEDEDTADAAALSDTASTSPPGAEPEAATVNTEAPPIEQATEPNADNVVNEVTPEAEPTSEPPKQDIENDNYVDEDDMDDFDPNDTELV